MMKLLDAIRYDLNFIRSHTLQPKWYKVLKVFILLGLLVGYYALFGARKTVVIFVVFLFLAFLIHMTYRVKTDRFMKSWLDFVVVEQNGAIMAKSIGKFYYAAVILSALIAIVISQTLVP
jgi:hypothetical protein